jgi:hypothetical protein
MTEPTLKVKPCPAEGDGVHKFVFHASCEAVEAGMTDEEAEPEIEALMTRAPNPPSEILDALRSARGERRNSSPRWTRPNPARIAAIAKQGPTLLELVLRSPVPVQFGEQSRTEEIIDTLFRRDS